MRKIILLVIMVGVLLSCNNTETNTKENKEVEVNSENFDWLLGSWQRLNEKEGRATFENWEKISDNEYTGMGFTLQGQDTVSYENLLVIMRDAKWNLEVRIKGSSEVTVFPLVEIKEKMFIGKNNKNDFPKKIHYFIENDQLKAIISGGGPVIPFDFERVK